MGSSPSKAGALSAPKEAHGRSPERLERGLHAAALLAVLACAFLLAAFPAISDDLFMHLAVGRRFFATGTFPDPDPWLSSLPDYHRRWIDVAYWGTHLSVTKLHELGGFTLLVVVKTLLVLAGACAPLWLAWRLRWRSFVTPAVLLLGLWAASDRFIERGSLVSDCFGPWVLAIAVAEHARPSRLRWLLPALVLVWTNFHPGVLVGLVFVGGAAALQPGQWKRWLPVVIACVVASVAHPDGARHLLWALETATKESTGAFRENNLEMMPTLSKMHADERETRLFLVLGALTWGALLYAFAKRARPWMALAAALAMTVLGLSAVRYVATASMAFPVIVVAALAAAARARTGERAATPRWAVLATAFVALVAGALDVAVAKGGYRAASGERRFGFGLDRAGYPFGAADFVRDAPRGGNIFNEHHWGVFLAWYWDGAPKVHFHGYVLDEDFYGEQYVAVNRSVADFDRIVRDHDLGVFMLRRIPFNAQQGPLLHRLLITRPEWHLVYWDREAMVFYKDRPENAAAIAQCEFRWLDPFRPERLTRGLKDDPKGVLEECKRQLRAAPDDPFARNVVERAFKLDPATLLR
ncbi:MAG: hypothetical protein IPJ77_17405 [Planctomycetes bacterium]|nr:hypothetical protein [Planctomycetota bacterium]